MNICICKQDLGTPQNLHISSETGSFKWSDDHLAWCTHGSIRSIRDLARFQGKEVPRPSKKYVNAINALGSGRPAWRKILPPDEFKRFAKSLVDFCSDVSADAGRYEIETFPKGNLILESLAVCNSNLDAINKHLSTDLDPGVKSTLQTFSNMSITRYDRFASITGRMSVKSGPDILRLKKGLRDILVPESDSRCIKQIDIISLEPRICLLIDGQEPVRDIYEHISKNVFKGDVARDVVKVATICAIYGMSAENLAQRIPGNINARQLLGEVRSYFNIPSLLQKLKKQSIEGFIENHYGRKIKADQTSPLVNYFLQSTGVDVSLIYFWNFLEASGYKISPKFVIHDAMVFTCEKEDLGNLESIANAGISVEGVGKIDAKIKEVT